MRKREIGTYRGLLEAQLAALVGQGERAVHEMVDANAKDPDPNDRATAEEERNWTLRLRDRERKLMTKIEVALARLDAGTFGTCTGCGRPISPARLRARPVTDLCLDCKVRSERAER
jgi:DnaK suppressor protein